MMSNKLTKATLKFFTESGLKAIHATKMLVRDLEKGELKRLFPKFKFSADKMGHEIPYFDLAGNPIGLSRYRLHEPDDGQPKYLQPTGQKSRFYFPPFVDWQKIAADPTIPIYITEGERKAAKACVEGFPCIGLGGVWNWRGKEGENEYSQPIKDFQLINWLERKAVIAFDSDSQTNLSIQEAIRSLRNTLVDRGADPYRIDLPHKQGAEKTGLDDFLKTRSGVKSFSNAQLHRLLLNETTTAAELAKTKVPPTDWIVPSLIPIGLTVVAGPPKVGKSFFALDIILATASGQPALTHFPTEETKSLYLALEDTKARMKKRMLMSKHASAAGDNTLFAFEWERVEDGGLKALERWLDKNPDCKVVFIDTFAKMRRIPKGRENLYHQDYEAIATLKKIADARRIGIVVIHHTKKGGTEDFLESVSGSMGITGAADTVIVLSRKRNEDTAILNITGRDVEEQSLAFGFDKGTWVYKGDAVAVQATETQKEVLEVMREAARPLRQSEISALAGRKNGGFRKTLLRLVRDGRITQNGLLYSVVEVDKETAYKFAQKPKKDE